MRRLALPIALLMMWMLGACALRPGASAEQCGNPVPSIPAHARNAGAPPDDAAAKVQRYGEAHADEFAGLYFDNEHGGRLVARFTSCVEMHQAALDTLLGPRDQVVVLEAVFTEATLHQIVESIPFEELADQGIAFVSAGVDVINNNVEITAKSDAPGAKRTLEGLGPPGAIAVDLYPADKPWTQPAGGPGWRFLGVFDTQLPYTVAFAVDDAQLATELQRYGLPDDPPAWDPAEEVVIFLSVGIGSTCPEVRLDAVVMDRDAGLVYGVFSDPFQPRGCTADLVGGKTFVVALARDELPPSPFRLQINEAPIGCEPDCGSGPSTLEVDLR
jgi:hypothetical protein